MENSNLIEKVAHIEEQIKSIMKQLDEYADKFKVQDRKLDDIHALTYSIKEIANEVKLMREDVNKLDKRVETIEQEPTKDYKDTKKLIKNQIAGFLLGIGLSFLAFVLGLEKYI